MLVATSSVISIPGSDVSTASFMSSISCSAIWSSVLREIFVLVSLKFTDLKKLVSISCCARSRLSGVSAVTPSLRNLVAMAFKAPLSVSLLRCSKIHRGTQFERLSDDVVDLPDPLQIDVALGVGGCCTAGVGAGDLGLLGLLAVGVVFGRAGSPDRLFVFGAFCGNAKPGLALLVSQALLPPTLSDLRGFALGTDSAAARTPSGT